MPHCIVSHIKFIESSPKPLCHLSLSLSFTNVYSSAQFFETNSYLMFHNAMKLFYIVAHTYLCGTMKAIRTENVYLKFSTYASGVMSARKCWRRIKTRNSPKLRLKSKGAYYFDYFSSVAYSVQFSSISGFHLLKMCKCQIEFIQHHLIALSRRNRQYKQQTYDVYCFGFKGTAIFAILLIRRVKRNSFADLCHWTQQ